MAPEDDYAFLFGAIGGICHVVVSHPFDLVKVRMQTGGFGYTSTPQATRHILKSEGWLGLYRGVFPVLVGAGPVMGVCYLSYTLARKLILDLSPSTSSSSLSNSSQSKDWKDSLSIPQIAAAGAVASVPTALILGPAERLKILLQVDNTSQGKGGPSIREAIKSMARVWRSGGGVTGLYKGTGLTMLRDMPGDAAYFATFETVKRFLLSLRPQSSPRSSLEETAYKTVSILLSGGLFSCSFYQTEYRGKLNFEKV
ncbi:carnitine transporter [Phlyctochytrium planicorne]|nr:carnitine transporter [Phlyctochytrium planicorne]